MKRDCFAYIDGKKCKALYENDCSNCRFYKTKEQYLKELTKLSEYSPLKCGNRHFES